MSGDEGRKSGTASLTDLTVVDEERAARLRSAGFETVGHVAAATREQLQAVDGVSRAVAGRLKTETEAVNPGKSTVESVRGIGETGPPRDGPDSDTTTTAIPRKGTVGTLRQSTEWLASAPLLFAAFFSVAVLFVAGILGHDGWILVGLGPFIVARGLASVVVEQRLAGNNVEYGTATRRVLGRLPSLVGVSLVYATVITTGLYLFGLPGLHLGGGGIYIAAVLFVLTELYLSARLVLAFPACVLDDKRTVESVSTGWRVAAGNVGKLVGMFVLAVAAIVAVASVPVLTVGFTTLESRWLYALSPVLAGAMGLYELAVARVYLENS